MPAYKACSIAVVITGLVAFFFFHLGLPEIATATLEGALNALWPIILVIIAALFVYNITLKTGAMDKIKSMLSSVSFDSRVIVLIIGWGFGNFMEGMAGFGTAVAIPASILVAMGYNPINTVLALLLVNSTPTPFGSVGVPTITLSAITGIEAITISGKLAVIQAVVTFISPFFMVMIIGKGAKALKGMWGYTLIASLSFLIPECFAAIFIGPELTDILGSIVSLICMVGMSWKNKQLDIPNEYLLNKGKTIHCSLTEALQAWSPFILIFIILLVTSNLIPFINKPLSSICSVGQFYSGADPNSLKFFWINTPGILIMIAGLFGGLIQGLSVTKIIKIYGQTIVENWMTIVTICSVLAVAKIMGYSGMISVIASILVTITGTFYPLIAPLIGMLGGFITGSGTSTAVLFGELQTQTALAIGSNPAWLAAANLLGAGIGKMVSPQGIAIGCSAAGLAGRESEVLRKSIKYAVGLVALGGLICYIFPFIGLA